MFNWRINGQVENLSQPNSVGLLPKSFILRFFRNSRIANSTFWKMEHTLKTKISPKIVYDAYPACDLLPIAPPEPDESFKTYRARVTDKQLIDCGDTLFAFLMFELTHAENPQDALHLLSGALNDILSIHAEISKRC